jgi:hypothetical protein
VCVWQDNNPYPFVCLGGTSLMMRRTIYIIVPNSGRYNNGTVRTKPLLDTPIILPNHSRYNNGNIRTMAVTRYACYYCTQLW